MYAVLWRVLPGPVALKVVWLVVLLAAVVAVCFEWVFPLVASWMPYDETTVGTDTGDPAYTVRKAAQLTSALALPQDH